MATRYFVQVSGVGNVGADRGYDSLDAAKRAQDMHPGSYVERVTNWGMASERSQVVQTGMGRVKGSKLPALFQRLSADDWRRVRAAVEGVGKGEVEAVALSVGYVDVGRGDGGQPYVGGMSMDPAGGGGLSYRKVPVMLWPKDSGGGASANTRRVFGGIEFKVRQSGGGAVVLVPAREADWWRLSSHQSTTDAMRRRDGLVGMVISDARGAGLDVEGISPR